MKTAREWANIPKKTQALISMLMEAANLKDVDLYFDAFDEAFFKAQVEGARKMQQEAAMEAYSAASDVLHYTKEPEDALKAIRALSPESVVK